jgi:hypothetical protein
MKKLVYLFCFMAHGAYAFHIVGGEIEFITLQPGRYQINVVQYFDEAQQENPGPEAAVEVYIFRSSDDELMSTHVLPFLIQQDVQYSNIECAIDQLQTSRVVWSSEIELDPEAYADPEGYYIVWERCCRNSNLVNIINPTGSGMTYVTELPPLWKNGQPFINSSPELFRPLSDYACQDQLYYIEFTGTDRDGDSLAYSLATPLNSSALTAVPIPKPKPHSPVIFNASAGYSDSTMILGDPKLAISNRGLLTVNPTQPGLHVFSVLVEEYRRGVRIGSVQRDFQMLVLDESQCHPPDPPQVAVQIPNRLFFHEEVDTLKYEFNEEKCFLFIAKNLSFGEQITLRAEGVNFDGDMDDIFAVNQFDVGEFRDSLAIEVCISECPPLGAAPFILDLIAADNACPLPQMDTVRLIFQVEPIPNNLPVMTLQNDVIVLQEGSTFETSFEVTDEDMDSLFVDLELLGYDDPGIFGFSVEETRSERGLLQGVFRWETDCDVHDFGLQQRFPVLVRAEDDDFCHYENPDYALMDMNVILPSNNMPETFVRGAPVNGLVADLDQTITFEVEAVDVDNDLVTLEMLGEGFNPAAYGVEFNPVTALGTATSTFSWYTDCHFAIPGGDNSFTFLFVSRDADLCDTDLTDTLRYTVELEIPPNASPQILPHDVYYLEVNEPFEMQVDASDTDVEDWITLGFFNGVRLPNSSTISFDPVLGQSSVSGIFRWTPECSLLRNGETTRYDVIFQVRDDFCPLTASDTMMVSFFIQETRVRFDNFLPPNAFSPNGDQMNDVFRLSGYDDYALNLPIDNCDDYFQYVTIHDRTGRPVYYSEDRNFVWDGGDLPPGVYFYAIRYSQTEYKNYVQLLR